MTDSFSEDSDDSVQDQDYIVSSEFSSESEEVNDDFLNLDENDLSQKLSEERHNWKGRPKRGRRNKYPGQTSRSRKRLKDSNQSYYSVKGKLNESKPFLRNFQCQCAKKCHEVVSEEMIEVLFKKYWDLGSYDLQTSFIGTTVQQFPVKRKRTKIVEGKSFTRVYLLNNINVCRNMFANTYRISTKRINAALKKVRTSQLKDQRGQKTTSGKKKMDPGVVQKIIDQISRFPTYISHYSRAETTAKCLPTELTEAKMYELYHLEEGNPKVSFSFYKTTFYTHFNLRFKPPSKDTCNKCDQLKAQIESTMDGEGKESIKAVHEEHLLKAKLARSVMKTDLGKAKRHPNFEALTYDMEKVLGLPKLPTNVVYYKRQLSIYNEGIHPGSTDIPYCFTWKEGVAGRGAQEVGSCLVKYINLHLKNGVEHLVLWSDSCGGQNRNLKIVLMMKTILSSHPTLKTISFKYLESGHSYLANDTDFGVIERALNKQVRLYTLNDFKEVVINCKKNKKFIVEIMEKEDFYSIQGIERQICNRKVDINKDKISWLKAKEIMIQKSNPHAIYFKESHDTETAFKELDISKTVKGRKTVEVDFKYTTLYPDGKTISIKK
nr:unnamed protein product [Callosobruchus chinensis]